MGELTLGGIMAESILLFTLFGTGRDGMHTFMESEHDWLDISYAIFYYKMGRDF